MGSHNETKRLRKSVKRRRGYAENLRRTASEIRATAPTEEDAAFAARLEGLADSELQIARDEERRAREIDADNLRPASRYGVSAQQMDERSAAAMRALKGTLSIDRVHFLLSATGGDDPTLSVGEGIALVEKRLGIVLPDPRPQVGRRIADAELRVNGGVHG